MKSHIYFSARYSFTFFLFFCLFVCLFFIHVHFLFCSQTEARLMEVFFYVCHPKEKNTIHFCYLFIHSGLKDFLEMMKKASPFCVF